MSKALPALMVVLGLLLLIATLYDVALRLNPSLIPPTPLPRNSPQGGVLTKTVTKTVVRLEPINSSLSWRYPLPLEGLVLDLSNASVNTTAEAVMRVNYSQGVLRNVTVTAVGRVIPEAWNSTLMVYVDITFSPPLPNGTEVDVIPILTAGTGWPAYLSISQHHLPMQGSVSRVNMTLCYPQQHLPSLTPIIIKLTHINNLSMSDSFLLLLKVSMPESARGSPYWRALIRLNGSTLTYPALLPLKGGGVLLASAMEAKSTCYVTLIKFSPYGKVLNAVSVSAAKHCFMGSVELRPLSNGYLLAWGDLATRKVTLILLSSSLSVVRAVTLTLPLDTLSWFVATLGDRVYVVLTWVNAPYVALLVLDGHLTLVRALAYPIGFPPNNLTPAETWCSISGVNGDLILTCMPAPPSPSHVLPKTLRTPVLVARVNSDGGLRDFNFLLLNGVGVTTPSIVKLGSEYLLTLTLVNIVNNTQAKPSALIITLSQNLSLKQAKLMNATPLYPALLRLDESHAALVGTVNSTPYLIILNKDGDVTNTIPQKPGHLIKAAAKDNAVYLATQKTQAPNNTTLTLTKLPTNKANTATATITITTTQTQATQQTTGTHITTEPLPPTTPITIKDTTNHITTQPAPPQITITPTDPK